MEYSYQRQVILAASSVSKGRSLLPSSFLINYAFESSFIHKCNRFRSYASVRSKDRSTLQNSEKGEETDYYKKFRGSSLIASRETNELWVIAIVSWPRYEAYHGSNKQRYGGVLKAHINQKIRLKVWPRSVDYIFPFGYLIILCISFLSFFFWLSY